MIPTQKENDENISSQKSEDEFKDAWTYLNSVNKKITEVGICIVEPPASWDKEQFFKIVDPAKYEFTTKTQNLHRLLKRDKKDFGFETGTSFTIQEFRHMADSFVELWSRCKTNLEKEKEYWNIVETGEEWVQVQYGSDLDVRDYGTGFPLNPNNPWKNDQKKVDLLSNRNKKMKLTQSPQFEYMSNSPWNVNNLPKRTFLHHINEGMPGITRPMIYVGMMFSSFCWHTEDNYLYSINYLHTGADKIWYAIPASFAHQFEQVLKEKVPHLVEKHPNLMYLLITQLSPRALVEAGIPVHTATQKKGQFIITAPRAYHAGWNTGFNCAESVNFALEDWLPLCREACNDYRFMRNATFSYEEFVIKAAANPDNSAVAQLLKSELEIIVKQEEENLKKVIDLGVIEHVGELKTSTYRKPCAVCKYDCYISGIYCSHHNTIACLQHAVELCDCQISQKRYFIHVNMSELKRLIDSLAFFMNVYVFNPLAPNGIPLEYASPVIEVVPSKKVNIHTKTKTTPNARLSTTPNQSNFKQQEMLAQQQQQQQQQAYPFFHSPLNFQQFQQTQPQLQPQNLQQQQLQQQLLLQQQLQQQQLTGFQPMNPLLQFLPFQQQQQTIITPQQQQLMQQQLLLQSQFLLQQQPPQMNPYLQALNLTQQQANFPNGLVPNQVPTTQVPQTLPLSQLKNFQQQQVQQQQQPVQQQQVQQPNYMNSVPSNQQSLSLIPLENQIPNPESPI